MPFLQNSKFPKIEIKSLKSKTSEKAKKLIPNLGISPQKNPFGNFPNVKRLKNLGFFL